MIYYLTGFAFEFENLWINIGLGIALALVIYVIPVLVYRKKLHPFPFNKQDSIVFSAIYVFVAWVIVAIVQELIHGKITARIPFIYGIIDYNILYNGWRVKKEDNIQTELSKECYEYISSKLMDYGLAFSKDSKSRFHNNILDTMSKIASNKIVNQDDPQISKISNYIIIKSCIQTIQEGSGNGDDANTELTTKRIFLLFHDCMEWYCRNQYIDDHKKDEIIKRVKEKMNNPSA